MAAVRTLAPLLPNPDAARGPLVSAEAAGATWARLGAGSYEAAAVVYQQRLQEVFTTTTWAFVVLGTLCYALTFLWCRESIARTPGPRATFAETLATLRTNTPLRVLVASSSLHLVGLFAVGGSLAFYAQYVLGSLGHLPLIVLVNSGVALLVTPLIPAVVARLGQKQVFQYCGLFTVVGGVGLWFVPTADAAVPASVALSLTLALVLLGVKGIGASLINTVMFGLGVETVEYGEWRTGRRAEGATYAIFSFTRKLAQAVGGAVGGFLLQLGGYLTGAALARAGGVQHPEVIDAIKFTIGPVPAILAILAMLAFVRYPLTDTVLARVRDENEARRRAGF